MSNMTRQEMFDKAVRGLRSQNWERSVDKDGYCVYDDGQGKHCAWGWVDESLWGSDSPHTFAPKYRSVNVNGLCTQGVGVAGKLSSEELWFAQALQLCHDEGRVNNEPLEPRLRALALKYNLVFPED